MHVPMSRKVTSSREMASLHGDKIRTLAGTSEHRSGGADGSHMQQQSTGNEEARLFLYKRSAPDASEMRLTPTIPVQARRNVGPISCSILHSRVIIQHVTHASCLCSCAKTNAPTDRPPPSHHPTLPPSHPPWTDPMQPYLYIECLSRPTTLCPGPPLPKRHLDAGRN